MNQVTSCAVIVLAGALFGLVPAVADPFSFSTGTPDGRIGTLSRPASPAGIQTETADDFILSSATSITQASFYGLIPSGAPLSSISQVEIEFYHVFPLDSGPFDGKVPTRTNSPADIEIGSATRERFAASTASLSVWLLELSTPSVISRMASANRGTTRKSARIRPVGVSRSDRRGPSARLLECQR